MIPRPLCHALLALLCLSPPTLHAATSKPNIVVILADDMGFGELSCLNPDKGKIATPQLDRIAVSGMTFTDGHSVSGVSPRNETTPFHPSQIPPTAPPSAPPQKQIPSSKK